MVNKAILFTDVKSSSILWKTHKNDMLSALNKHDKQIRQACKKNKGMVIKTIGDAYMIMFDNMKSAYNFCIDHINISKKNPIILKTNNIKSFLKIRMGFCYGKVNLKKTNIQGKQLLDVFGSTVNKASRMESKLSDVDGFAFCRDDNKEINVQNEFKINLKNYTVKKLIIDNKCNMSFIRSNRLLNIKHECLREDVLHGVGKVIAYKINPV